MKDEDPGYALHTNHMGAWVGAVELGEQDILLLGALESGGRVELDGTTLHGFYENKDNAPWLVRRGREEVFSKYVEDCSMPGTPCHLGEPEIMKPGCPEQTV
jgi:hypothetical protein